MTLGTPQVLTDGTGQVAWEAHYTPFGRASVISQGPTFNLRFPGQYFDAETGLHYNWHRYYDPAIGRYITSDPIGLAGGLNTYGYVGGNPLVFIDPAGLWSFTFDFYYIFGGGLSIKYWQGKVEVIVRGGIGGGGGATFNPAGMVSLHAERCDAGFIVRTTGSAYAELSLGPLGTGVGVSGTSGNGLIDDAGGGYSDVWGYATANRGNLKLKIGAGANVSGELGIYFRIFEWWANEKDNDGSRRDASACGCGRI